MVQKYEQSVETVSLDVTIIDLHGWWLTCKFYTLYVHDIIWDSFQENDCFIKKRPSAYYKFVIEHGSFTPLVFTTSGGMGKCASVTYKRLASLLSTKQEQNYGATIAWVRCCLSFSLLRSSSCA